MHNNLPILIQKLKFTYLEWTTIQKHIPKIHRYSLGIKIDNLFIEITEMSFYIIQQNNFDLIQKLIAKNDLLKLFLQILLESRGIDNNKYISLNLKIDEIGKIMFGIKRNITKTAHSLGRK